MELNVKKRAEYQRMRADKATRNGESGPCRQPRKDSSLLFYFCESEEDKRRQVGERSLETIFVEESMATFPLEAFFL